MHFFHLAASLLILATSSQAFSVDFVRWDLTPYSPGDIVGELCMGGTHWNREHIKSAKIDDGKCYTDKKGPYEAFVYDLYV